MPPNSDPLLFLSLPEILLSSVFQPIAVAFGLHEMQGVRDAIEHYNCEDRFTTKRIACRTNGRFLAKIIGLSRSYRLTTTWRKGQNCSP
jgi:hypothetical protein